MTENYVAIVPCHYNPNPGSRKKRFRIGDVLPPGWKPNKHFKPEAEARNLIQRDKYINMGFDPERERSTRAAQQGRNREMRGGIDMDEAERVMKQTDSSVKPKNGIDFMGVDAKDHTREAFGNALFEQFGLKLNHKITNKTDLIAAGREAAKRAEQ